MLWLYILLGIVLFIALVMFIPITLRASYKEKFWCAVYIGFVKLQLVPAKPKKEKKKKKAKKQTQKTEQPKKATEKKPSLIKQYGIEWLLNLIKKVAELAVSALQDFFSHILVKKLSLSISVAGDDAADTAIKYGKYCAVVYPAVGTIVRVVKCKGYGVDINPKPLHFTTRTIVPTAIVRVVKCKGYGVDINPNFSEKAETEINFDFAARIFAFRLIGLAVKHGIKGIKLLAEVKND